MQIGRRIYWDKATGNIVYDNGERSGDVVATTVEQDFATYDALSARVPSTVGVMNLSYGQFASDFAACDGYHVNPTTEALEFTYPTGQPQVEPVFQQPLSEQIAAMKIVLDDLIFGGGL